MRNNLKTTFTVICLCLAFVLSSCGAQNEATMQIDGSNEVVSESPLSDEIVTAFCSEDGEVSVPLFLYTLDTTKAEIMAQYKSIEEYYGITIESVYGTPIGDTKEFWGITYSELEDGTAYTLGEYAFDRTVNACKQMLAIEGLASALDYSLPDTFSEKREEEYRSMIEEYGSADRWSVELAKDNLTINDWDRVLRYYYTGSYLSEFMFENDFITEPTDDQAKASLEENNINFKFMNFYLTAPQETEGTETEGDTQSAESSESADEAPNDETDASSEDLTENGNESGVSDEVSTESVDLELANAEIKAKAQKIYEELINKSLSYKDALAQSDDGELIASYYPDGMSMTNEEFVGYFKIEAKELKSGDFHYYEDAENNIIYIVQRIDFPETKIDDEKENLKNDLFSDCIVDLCEKITVNEDVVSEYKNIWETNS